MKNLVALLEASRKSCGKSFVALSKEVGVTESYVRMIFLGRRLPRNPLLGDSLAKALGIPYPKYREALLKDLHEEECLKIANREPEVELQPELELEAVPRVQKAKTRTLNVKE